jgi:hypothetical protein
MHTLQLLSWGLGLCYRTHDSTTQTTTRGTPRQCARVHDCLWCLKALVVHFAARLLVVIVATCIADTSIAVACIRQYIGWDWVCDGGCQGEERFRYRGGSWGTGGVMCVNVAQSTCGVW